MKAQALDQLAKETKQVEETLTTAREVAAAAVAAVVELEQQSHARLLELQKRVDALGRDIARLTHSGDTEVLEEDGVPHLGPESLLSACQGTTAELMAKEWVSWAQSAGCPDHLLDFQAATMAKGVVLQKTPMVVPAGLA